MTDYQPNGAMFRGNIIDAPNGWIRVDMMLVSDDDPREELRGWLLYKHPDGQWVTLRKATDDDLVYLNRRLRLKATTP